MTSEQINQVLANMLELSQTYSVVILKGRGNLDFKYRANNAVCFGAVFTHVNKRGSSLACSKKIRLRVTMYTDPKANIQNNVNNVVFLKREQIIQWMDELCIMFQAYNLTYKIINTKLSHYVGCKPLDGIHIVVKAQNIGHFWIKWILSYIRLMSEAPCSFVLPEAFTLRECIPELKAYPVLSTFMFIWSTCTLVHAFTADSNHNSEKGEYRAFVPRTMTYLIDAVSKKVAACKSIDNWHKQEFTPKKFVLDPKDYPVSVNLHNLVRECFGKRGEYRFTSNKYIREYVLVGKIPDKILKLYKDCFEKIKESII